MSHFNFERVRELVQARPALAKATWDWGYGDWESALGAASHTGNYDIASLLIEHGARPTLFSATMMGQLELVQAFVDAVPGIQSTPGPHGIPLLEHARLGGDRALAVHAFLLEIGGAGGPTEPVPLAEDERQTFFGVYRFGPEDDEFFEVYDQRGVLMIRRGTDTGRALTHLGEATFHPAGASAVRIRFALENGVPQSLTVDDPEPLVTGVR